MKLLLPLLGALGFSLLALPLLVVAVIATHPWLAVGALTAAPTIVQTAPVSAATPTPVAISAPVPGDAPRFTSDEVIAEAMKWVSGRVPYLWGGCTTHGVDCSCFVRTVLAVFGIHAPRTTVEQIRWAIPIRRDQLAVGDIVFFDDTCTKCGPNPTHEGLYIGGGLMVQAGDPVQVSPVFSGYYAAHFAGAGRPH